MTRAAKILKEETDRLEKQTEQMKSQLFEHFRRSSYSALVVEDHDSDALYIGLEVNKVSGVTFEIFCVKTLKEAKKYLKHTRPDVIVLDLTLPDARGPVCVEELVQFGVPIVVHSGVGEFADFQLALDAGAISAMSKGDYSGNMLPLTLLSAIKTHQRVVA